MAYNNYYSANPPLVPPPNTMHRPPPPIQSSSQGGQHLDHPVTNHGNSGSQLSQRFGQNTENYRWLDTNDYLCNFTYVISDCQKAPINPLLCGLRFEPNISGNECSGKSDQELLRLFQYQVWSAKQYFLFFVCGENSLALKQAFPQTLFRQTCSTLPNLGDWNNKKVCITSLKPLSHPKKLTIFSLFTINQAHWAFKTHYWQQLWDIERNGIFLHSAVFPSNCHRLELRPDLTTWSSSSAGSSYFNWPGSVWRSSSSRHPTSPEGEVSGK